MRTASLLLTSVVTSIVMIVFVSAASAKEQAIKLSNGSELVVNLQTESSSKTGKSSGEVFVLLNGLVYELGRWDKVANLLTAQGHTVIRYAYSAQPANLRRLAKGAEPKFFENGLDPQTMGEELRLVLEALHVNGKVHLVGLSYGASVASAFTERHPELVEDVVFVSPLVVPTDNYDGRSAGLRAWLSNIRYWENATCSFYGAFNPWLCTSRDFWYDTFYKSLYQTYLLNGDSRVADGVEPEIYKKSLYHLIRAARDFDLKVSVRSLKNVSMFVASEDQPALRADQELAWQAVPDAERRSYVLFEGAHHALPDEAPERLANLLMAVAGKDPAHVQGARSKVKADR